MTIEAAQIIADEIASSRDCICVVVLGVMVMIGIAAAFIGRNRD